MGQKVKTLVDKYQETGSYNVYWNATNYNGVTVANGIYFYRIKSGDFKMTKKMLLLK
jgi:flagellar hook assembly protein FlgD